MMKSLDDDSHVKTRLCQYEALNNGKGVYIAKQIVLSKLKGQNILLEKYNLDPNDEEAFQLKIDEIKLSDLNSLRQKLTGIEGKFREIFQPDIRVIARITKV